jgi:hypothetical protein
MQTTVFMKNLHSSFTWIGIIKLPIFVCWVWTITINPANPLHKQYISKQPPIWHTYSLNIRHVQNTVVKRMRCQALSQHEMQMYVGIVTLITLHFLNNLLAQKWARMSSESAVYTELVLCVGMLEDHSTAWHITVFKRVLVVQFQVKSVLLSCNDNITPFTSQHYSFYVTTMLLLDRPYLLSWWTTL